MIWTLWRYAFSLVWLLVAFNHQLPLEADEPARHVGQKPIFDTSPLLEIERRVLPECLVAGPNRHPDLPAYYAAANPDLSEHLAGIQRGWETAGNRPCRSMTMVAGAAGVGKTFIKGQVFKESWAEGVVCKFDIKNLYRQWQASGLVEEKPDLYCGETVLNRLPGLKDQQKNGRCLVDYLQSQSAAFYVIDSLDEVHPDDYRWILDQVEQFVFQEQHQFVQVFLFGRGLAFQEYWQANHPRDRRDDIHLYMLEAPQFRTTGDLLVSSWNYDDFRYHLRWSPRDNDPGAMPLAAYQQWVAEGYPVSGKFGTVTCQANESMNPGTRGLLENWSRTYRMTGPMLANLAGNGILRDIVEDHAIHQQPFDERKVMEAFLVAWLERDGKSSDRPSRNKPEHLDLYLQLLQEVAIKYLAENRLDQNGYFAVADDDVIQVDWQGQPLTFSVARILNRSGLKLFDPREAGIPRFRFEPIWLHRLLVEMHNDQVSQHVSR